MIIENESLHNEGSLTKTQPPRPWRVVLLNDDFTTVDFVVDVLTQFYGKMHQEAEILALEIHFTGQGEAGIYTREIAEHKVAQTLARARAGGHPLRVVTEMVD
jgi:ATP-dependent Clp protease adaptor protein ClpS